MYTQGENFYYTIDEEEYELHILEVVTLGENEYLVTEDYSGDLHIFRQDEDEDDLEYIDDKRDAEDVIQFWKDEYLLDGDIGDYEEDEYYDREDREIDNDYYDDYDDNYNDEY